MSVTRILCPRCGFAQAWCQCPAQPQNEGFRCRCGCGGRGVCYTDSQEQYRRAVHEERYGWRRPAFPTHAGPHTNGRRLP